MCNKMSDVRLSNASPTLERVDARQPDHGKPSVCRNLFGTADREETMREARAAARDNERAFVDRWNFDPAADRPLSPGNYEWVVESNAPEFFFRPPHARRGADLNDNDERRRDAERSDSSDNGPRKRPAGVTGGCSSECQTKRSRTGDDDDDDDDQPQPACRTAASAERTSSTPENETLLH
ncbi:cyclin-dependent kinase inhibitor 1Ba [Lampris incognitus]|uniref:cyclin-dependent kinase inhibitor 1Ba n=1 Tax=Lampris incognitus TaxID=2546036 RepID=UPI0024B4C1E1|nr:cyclin-dependent kinase inhibitor 1Ba [Lampris incognitus]